MKQGILCYNFLTERFDFHYDDTYYGLHCGECLEILLNGKWIQTRIELANDWYLIGLKDIPLIGQTVRMK